MSNDFEDDDSHPVQKVNVIDVVQTIQGGGAAYVLVIARPIGADSRSLHRLEKKIEVYVGDLFSKESQDVQGTPKPGKMWIYIYIHKDSKPEAFAVIKRCEPWILENGIELIVKTTDDRGVAVETISAQMNL